MDIRQNFPLQTYNSFNIETSSPCVYFPCNLFDLERIAEAVADTNFYVLGDGSNSLFVDSRAPVIIKPNFRGIKVQEDEEGYTLTVGASENWHQLVCFCIDKGINGLENLALIPGSVGAAPVQNIGAYGVELADYCLQVDFFDLVKKELVTIAASDCQFAYRESVFKHELHQRGIITQVTLRFSKNWQAKLAYHGLDHLPASATASEVMQQVISLRESKLPDPKTLPNAGSFFKNPVISAEQFNLLKSEYPNIANYPQANGQVKLAAGWLIDQLGFKGGRFNGVGVHQQQALVLVNYTQGTGRELVGLAKYIQQQVANHFAVDIEPEVRMITEQGEQAFSEITDHICVSELSHD